MNDIENWLDIVVDSTQTLNKYFNKPYKNFNHYYEYFLYELLKYENQEKTHSFNYNKLLSNLIKETENFAKPIYNFYNKKLDFSLKKMIMK